MQQVTGENAATDEETTLRAVSVQPADGKAFQILMPEAYTVRAAKEQIALANGSPAHMQRLYGSKSEVPLADTATITDTLLLMMLASRDYSGIQAFDGIIPLAPRTYPGGTSFMPDGTVVWVGFYADADIRDADTGAVVKKLPDWKTTLHGDSRQLFIRNDGSFIFIAATDLDRIAVFLGPCQTFVRFLGESADLRNPNGVAASATTVFVADTGNDRLVFFDFDSGDVTKTVGTHGDAAAQFSEPTSLEYIESRELLAVADRRNHRIQLLTVDGTHVRSFGAPGGGLAAPRNPTPPPHELRLPNDVCIDVDDNLLVYDTANKRIAVFTLEGDFICSVMSGFFRDSGNTYSNISCCPTSGRIAVSDDDNHRLALLRPELAQ